MKVWNYIILSFVLAFLLQMAGIPVAESVLTLVGVNLNNSNVGNSNLYTVIFGSGGILILAAATGIAIGFITKSSSENFIILPFLTASVVTFGSTFYGVLQAASDIGWAKYVIWLIFGAYALGFLVAIVECFRGTD